MWERGCEFDGSQPHCVASTIKGVSLPHCAYTVNGTGQLGAVAWAMTLAEANSDAKKTAVNEVICT